MSVAFCFSHHYRATGLMWRSPSSIDHTLGCLLLGASMAFADVLQPVLASTEPAANDPEMAVTMAAAPAATTTAPAVTKTSTATAIDADEENETRRAASSAISGVDRAVSRLFVRSAAALARALLPVVAAAEPRTIKKTETPAIKTEAVDNQDVAESTIETASETETEHGTESEAESKTVAVSASESESASVSEASVPLPLTVASVGDDSLNTPSNDSDSDSDNDKNEDQQDSSASAPKIEVDHDAEVETNTEADMLRALLVDAEDHADDLAGLLIQSETHVQALLTYNNTLRLMLRTSRRMSQHMSQCETSLSTMSCSSSTARSSIVSSTIDKDAADQDEAAVIAAVCTTTGNTTSCASSTAVKRITSAVTDCDASESWRGSSAVRQQLACRTIRQLPYISQWDASAVTDAMHLDAACDVNVVDHHIQQQQLLQETIDVNTVCKQLSTALDASVYILTTPTDPLEASAPASASSPASDSTTEPVDVAPSAEFYAYDAKKCVVRSRSAVEWLSALTGELVTARRCPVILRARDLDLVECSLLRFADVASASPSSTGSDCTDTDDSDNDSDDDSDNDSDDDDSDADDEGIWV
jgi:hypothetical protein